jgi:hypothetical protein
MSRIWPVQGKVEWPPAVSIDTVGDIRALHDGVMKPPPY